MPMLSSPSAASSSAAHPAAASPLPSYLQADKLGPWGIYLQQVDRVVPYLGHLARLSLIHIRPCRQIYR